MKKLKKTPFGLIIINVFLYLFAISCLMPFLWMISASLKFEVDVFKFPIEWIPSKVNAWENYSEVWSGKYNFILAYWNSIKVTVITTALQLIISSTGGYAFAKINFKFKNPIFAALLATMMIPEQVTIVPKFLMFKWLGLYDTHASLILICSFSVYGMFLARQYMVTLPDSLIEASKIDGAGQLRIFTQIILPLSKPILATLALLRFVWTWNDYQHPLILIKSKALYTLQLGMRQFADDTGIYYSLTMAAAVSAILPLLIIFILSQKYVIGGLTVGAVKG